MATLAIPTVHMNGTSADELLRQVCDAGEAIQDAMKALGQAGPNGRDYYVQGSDAMAQAAAQHKARMDALRAIYDDLTAIADGIDAQPTRRAA